jgi:hypothetical protein
MYHHPNSPECEAFEAFEAGYNKTICSPFLYLPVRQQRYHARHVGIRCPVQGAVHHPPMIINGLFHQITMQPYIFLCPFNLQIELSRIYPTTTCILYPDRHGPKVRSVAMRPVSNQDQQKFPNHMEWTCSTNCIMAAHAISVPGWELPGLLVPHGDELPPHNTEAENFTRLYCTGLTSTPTLLVQHQHAVEID